MVIPTSGFGGGSLGDSGSGDSGGGSSGGGGSGADQMQRDLRDIKREIRQQRQETDPDGLDGGEPVSGVDGAGDPRQSPDDPQQVEGPERADERAVAAAKDAIHGSVGTSDGITSGGPGTTDGMGGSVEDRQLGDEPTDGMGGPGPLAVASAVGESVVDRLTSPFRGGQASPDGALRGAPRGAQRAVDQTPVAVSDGQGGVVGVDIGGDNPTVSAEVSGTARGPLPEGHPLSGKVEDSGPGGATFGTINDDSAGSRDTDVISLAGLTAGAAATADSLARGADESVSDIVSGAERVGAVGGDILLEGEGAPDATDIDERARAAADVVFDASFEGEFADEFSPVGGDDTAISGPHINIAAVGGGGDLLPAGEAGDLDVAVTDQLTQGKGLFDDETTRKILDRAQRARELFGVEEETESLLLDAGAPEDVASFGGGWGAVPGDIAALPSTGAYAADLTVETAANLPGAVSEFGPKETGLAILESGGRATESAAKSAEEDPSGFLGQITGEVLAGAAAGKAFGVGGRLTRDRVRTAGGTKVDLDAITQEPAIRNLETGGAGGDRFPGAADPDLYRTDPADAVRTQATDMTPDIIDERFVETGADEGVVLKKALDVEPEGPDGRPGFEASPGETLEDFDYETPGAFVGPELSPHFLRAGAGESSFSLVPGLPNFGSKPTGVLAKTDVENPDADDLAGFNTEMIERSGQTTAVTKPAGVGSPGEIEAVIPPGAQFRDIGGSRTRQVLRRAGIGSDFFTEVPTRSRISLPGGLSAASPFGAKIDIPGTDRSLRVPGGTRRVPLRPVVPDADAEDLAAVETAGDMLDNVAFGGGTLDELTRPLEPTTDRPLPVFGPGGGASGTQEGDAPPSREGGADPSGGRDFGVSDGAGSFVDPTGGMDSAPSSGGSEPDSPGGPPSSGGSAPSSGGSGVSGPSSGGTSPPSSPTSPPPSPGLPSPPTSPPSPPTSPPSDPPGFPSIPPGLTPPDDPPQRPPDLDFGIGSDPDDKKRDLVYVPTEQQFIREIGTVEDVLGIGLGGGDGGPDFGTGGGSSDFGLGGWDGSDFGLGGSSGGLFEGF